MHRLLLLVLLPLIGCHRTSPGKEVAEAADLELVAAPPVDSVTRLEVSFSPNGGCTDQVVRHIREAQKSVYVLAYSFTSKPIAAALVAKRLEGKDVRVIVDRSDKEARGAVLPVLRSAGIPILVDSRHQIAHNKTMIIDQQVVLTGSFNFTVAAETSNAENCLTVWNSDLASRYLSDWHVHESHSNPESR